MSWWKKMMIALNLKSVHWAIQMTLIDRKVMTKFVRANCPFRTVTCWPKMTDRGTIELTQEVYCEWTLIPTPPIHSTWIHRHNRAFPLIRLYHLQHYHLPQCRQQFTRTWSELTQKSSKNIMEMSKCSTWSPSVWTQTKQTNVQYHNWWSTNYHIILLNK